MLINKTQKKEIKKSLTANVNNLNFEIKTN